MNQPLKSLLLYLEFREAGTAPKAGAVRYLLIFDDHRRRIMSPLSKRSSDYFLRFY